jgi:TolA-binding protein
MVQAWRTHAAAKVQLPRARRPSTGVRLARSSWALSLAASALAGGLFALYLGTDPSPTPVPVGSGRFELRIGDAAMQSGAVAEGQVLESGHHGRIDVDLGSARVLMGFGTRLRFDRMSEHELRLSLQKGRVDVDFHPVQKGTQRMVVESLAARVTVVGTRFSVEVDALGNTEVTVTEGVVEVAPRSGAEPRRVAAGERFEVRADDGDDSERAVRSAIEQQLGEVIVTAFAGDGAADGTAGAQSDTFDMEFELEDEGSVASLQDAANQHAARRLTAARKLLRQGRHQQARDRLRDVADGSSATRYRVEALTLMAESFTAQGDIPRATEVYARADQIAPHHPAGHNARFALARLLERYARDDAAAMRAYRSYLERAPSGALASQARQALCRLGDAKSCH